MQSASQQAWPDWVRPGTRQAEGDQEFAYRQLARYVIRDVVLSKGLVPPDIHRRGASLSTPDVVAEIHSLLVDRLSYQLNPWSPKQRHQRIRSTDKILRDGGTCLDLALMVAAICLESYLRPLIVIARNQNSAHAFLAISAVRNESVASGRLTDHYSFSKRLLPIDMDQLVGDGWLIYDPTEATDPNMGFAEAASNAAAIIATEGVSSHVIDPSQYWIIDPAYCQASGNPDDALYTPPVEDERVSSYLPNLTTMFQDYPSRAQETHRVHEAARTPGVTVIRGESGSGKSVLALKAARTADNGCGWFLDGSSPRTLVRSLAVAELHALGNSEITLLARLDDRKELANMALHRLRKSAQSWIVVLDNADAELDARLTRWIPTPDHRYSQSLIVTTTNPSWDSYGDGTPIILEPLERGDQDVLLEEEVWEALYGLPLLLNVARSLQAKGSSLDGLGSARTVDEAAQILVDEALATFQAAHLVRDFSKVVGLLPAGGFRVAKDSDWALAASDLAQLGLLQHDDGGAARMHRIFAAAFRSCLTARETQTACRFVTSLPDAVDLLDDSTNEEIDILASSLDNSSESVLGYHTLGKLMELRGDTPSSAGYFVQAAKLITENPRSSSGRVLAECLHGHARKLFQGTKPPLADLDQATELVKRAQTAARAQAQNATDPDERLDSLRAEARSLAFEGLIERKRVSRLRATLGPDEARARYDRALKLIQRSDESRSDLVADPRDPELARSRYNFAGTYIGLAKTAGDLDDALRHIARAEAVYSDVQRRRELIYKRPMHPHIAACICGRGITSYYKALFSSNGADRISGLGAALRLGTESLLLRQELDPSGVGSDVGKSRALVYKSQLATANFAGLDLDTKEFQARIAIDDQLDEAVEQINSLVRFRDEATESAAL